MNSRYMRECHKVLSGKALCNLCGHCDPWVLCVCYTCSKEWWCRLTYSERWCNLCLKKELDTVRLLLVTGHEPLGNSRIFDYRADWQRVVIERAKIIQICDLECSKTNLVPVIWQIPKEDWERTKKKCEKRFAWKRKIRGKN